MGNRSHCTSVTFNCGRGKQITKYDHLRSMHRCSEEIGRILGKFGFCEFGESLENFSVSILGKLLMGDLYKEVVCVLK